MNSPHDEKELKPGSALNSAGPVDLEEKRRRALAAAGRFRSGLNDLAENHDKYLERDFISPV